MGIFTGLFKSRDKPTNSYDSPSYTYFFGRANSGKRVTDRTALQHIAVYACVRVLSEAIAQLPLHLYKYNDKGKERVPQHPLYFLLHDLWQCLCTNYPKRSWRCFGAVSSDA